MKCLRVDLDSRVCDVVTARIRPGYRCNMWQLVADAGLHNPHLGEWLLIYHALEHYIMQCNIISQCRPASTNFDLCRYFTESGIREEILMKFPKFACHSEGYSYNM